MIERIIFKHTMAINANHGLEFIEPLEIISSYTEDVRKSTSYLVFKTILEQIASI